jgi:flagellar motor switch protein FliM
MESNEILSSEESAALRATPATDGPGPRPDGSVVDVHTDHWERIPAGRVPALDSIAERICSLLTGSARRLLRRPVEVSPGSGRPERWGSYARRLTAPTSLTLLDIRPHNLKGVVCLDGELVFTLVDLFFGGPGRAPRPATLLELTPIEVRLVRRFVTLVAADLREAWKPFVELDFKTGPTEMNPVFAGVAGAAEPMAVQTIGLTVGGREFSFDIVLPGSLVEPIRFLRDAGTAGRQGADPARWEARLTADVQDARVRLRAVLASTEITLRDLVDARPGDIIPLDIPASLVLYAGDTPLLDGTFGTCQGHNAVRITKPANRTTVGEKYGTRDLD